MHSLSRRNLIVGLILPVTGLAFVATSRSMAANKTPLAIRGYDPVAYFTDGKPVHGLPEFEFQWDEHLYRFASAEHRDRFKTDPVSR
jgi:hypothetical protein